MTTAIKSTFGLVISFALAAPVLAAETQSSGNLQAQVSYYEPKYSDNRHWVLEMPDSYVGLTAYEELDGATLLGYIEVGLDILSDSDDAAEFDQAYLSWTQSAYSISAGQMKTLEQSYIIDNASYLKGVDRGGSQASLYTSEFETNALRVTAQSSEQLAFSGQVVLDPDTSELEWSLATLVSTSEGTISLTYRDVPEESPLWGNQITWVSGTTSLSGAYIYQDELLGYDVNLSMSSDGVEAFFGYSRTEDDDNRWQVGVHQTMSDAVSGYSELLWEPEDSEWFWTTGFQLAF